MVRPTGDGDKTERYFPVPPNWRKGWDYPNLRFASGVRASL
jgi:hypothetical protein